MRFFCDTYALVEFVKGNKAYAKFVAEELHTSLLNLYELYYNLLKEYEEETARGYFYQFSSLLIPIMDQHIFAGGKFKLKNQKQNISYTDALGYAMARQEGMKFLTGDKEF
ncbi:MAG: PIN domain-containing protein, partial [Nanoarchaeota archaeon]